ncbi:hypothetical protein F4819DRAFT_434487 [Hypoxylon fuscum]|nr:hypothetical protein F4819DRAFT_434487 [Hypoxylon fuscum]
MQPQSPLFSLAPEVRERIYEFYLAFDHSDFGDALRPQLVYIDATYQTAVPNLMLTCKSLYQELAPMVHGQAVIRMLSRGWTDRQIGIAVHGTLRFDRLEKLWLLVGTEYPNWNSWLSFFEMVIERVKNLKTLVIDWGPRPVHSVGWVARVDTKKTDEFFSTIASLENIRVIQIYGNIPDGWMSRLEDIAPHVVHYPFRWWREPGMDW